MWQGGGTGEVYAIMGRKDIDKTRRTCRRRKKVSCELD